MKQTIEFLNARVQALEIALAESQENHLALQDKFINMQDAYLAEIKEGITLRRLHEALLIKLNQQ
jgi:hypothetical protein